MPSFLRGIDIIAPSGKFCIAIPAASVTALAIVMPVSGESAPASATPTAIPSGILWNVTVSASITDLFILNDGPSGWLLSNRK